MEDGRSEVESGDRLSRPGIVLSMRGAEAGGEGRKNRWRITGMPGLPEGDGSEPCRR